MLAAPIDAAGTWQARLGTSPVRIPATPDFVLKITQSFQHQIDVTTGSPTIRVTGYQYELGHLRGAQVLAYHLHPTGPSPVRNPHLHVGMTDPNLNYGKRHLVTGHISLQKIIRCLITEFDITPLRPDWRDILESPAED